MAYQEFSSVNSSEGLQVVFVYVNDVTSGMFGILLLFALFTITLLGTFFASKRQTGQGNLAMSTAVAGFLIAVVSLVLSIIPNFLNTGTVVFCIAIAVLGALWFFMSDSSE